MINAAVESTFALGNFVFRLRCSDWELLNSVSKILPSMHNSPEFQMDAPFTDIDLNIPVDIGGGQIVDLRRVDSSLAIGYILDTALKFHEHLLWLEGATLLDGSGRLVMLCGGTHSGKTTLALALHLQFGWKVVSEDLTLIDPQDSQIVPFPRPLSLRAGTAERIAEAVGTAPGKRHTQGEWYFDRGMYDIRRFALPPRVVIFLKPVDAENPGSLKAEVVSSAIVLKQLLPLSNLLRKPDATHMIDSAMEAAACFVLEGGHLADRLNWFKTIQL